MQCLFPGDWRYDIIKLKYHSLRNAIKWTQQPVIALTKQTSLSPYKHDKQHACLTSSNGNICAGNSPVHGEFPAQRPVTQSFDVFFDMRLNKRLSKQSWGWWFEMPSRSLWRHRNVLKLQSSYASMKQIYACPKYSYDKKQNFFYFFQGHI